MFGNLVHKAQMEDAPATVPPTKSSLYEPMPTGTGVSGGVKAHITDEDRGSSYQYEMTSV